MTEAQKAINELAEKFIIASLGHNGFSFREDSASVLVDKAFEYAEAFYYKSIRKK